MQKMRALLTVVFVAGLACDDGDEETCPEETRDGQLVAERDPAANEGAGCPAPAGPPTESVCPPTSTLTYESFGQPFMQMYCQRCHSAAVTGEARMDAPADHNFDSLEEILPLAEHIDGQAGAGPAATNELMPIGAPTPTLEERQQLAEWLACEIEAL